MFKKLNSYFLEMLIIITILSLLPFLLFNLYAVNSLVNESIDEINKRNVTETKQIGLMLEKSLDNIYHTVLTSVNDNFFKNEMRVMDDPRLKNAKIISAIVRIASLNEYIDSGIYINLNESYALLSNYGLVRDEEQYYLKLKNILSERVGSGITVSIPVEWQFLIQNRNYVLFIIPLTNSNIEYLAFNVDIVRLYDYFVRELEINHKNQYFYLVNSFGEPVIDYDLFPDINAEFMTMMKKHGDHYVDGSTIYNHFEISRIGWHLIKETDITSLYMKIDSLKRNLFFLIIITCIFIISMVFASTRHLHKPIEIIQKKFNKIARPEKSNKFGEMKFINTAVDEMIRTTEGLQSSLETNISALRKSLLYSLIKSGSISGIDVNKYLGDYNGFFAVVIFGLLIHTDSSSSVLIFERIKEIILKEFKCEFFDDNDTTMIGLVNLDVNDPNSLKTILSEIPPVFNVSESTLTVSIGKIYSELEKINDSYVEALYAHNLYNILPNKTGIVSYDSLPDECSGMNLSKDTAVQKLEMAISLNDENTYSCMLDELLGSNLKVTEFYSNIFTVMSLAIKLFENEGVLILKEINNLFKDINSMNIMALKKFLVNKFKTHNKSEQAFSENNMYIDAINNFIEKNYDKNISLDDAAEYVGITKQYICNLLKKYADTSFVEMLNQYRINAAVKLIEAGKIKKSIIYKTVGFSSGNYYAKVFKQKLGITPGQYTKLLS